MPIQYIEYHVSRGDGSQLYQRNGWDTDTRHLADGESYSPQGPGTNGNRGWRAFSVLNRAGFALHRVYYRPREGDY